MVSRIRTYESLIKGFGDGSTTYADLLIKIFRDIDARVSIAEDISSSVTVLQNDLLSYGRELINETVGQVVDEVSVAADLGMVFTGRSVTSVEIGTGIRDVVINEDQRLVFAPAAMLVLVDADNPANVMWGRKLSYIRDTGVLSVDVLSFEGSGEVSSWIITAGAIADMAGKVSITPVGFMTSLNLQGALGEISTAFGALADAVWTKAEADERFVALDGGTMTGPLVLSGDPTDDDHAARRGYVNDLVSEEVNILADAVNGKLSKSGGTMTGPILLPAASPTDDNHAARKKYVVDLIAEKLSLAGGEMTGGITLPNATAFAGRTVGGAYTWMLALDSLDRVRLGSASVALVLFGSAANPLYGTKKIILEGDTAGLNDVVYTRAVSSVSFGTSTPNLGAGTTDGSHLTDNGSLYLSSNGLIGLNVRRRNTNGNFATFRKDTAIIGSIGTTDGVSTNYTTTSDARLKTDLQAIDPAIVDLIDMYDFAWVNGAGRSVGGVAQELQAVFPQAVMQGETEADMWSVDYSKFVPLLIEAVKELRTRVAELEALATAP